VQGESVTITRYVGEDQEVAIPETIASIDSDMIFTVTAIGDYAFAGGLFVRLGAPPDIKKDKKAFKNCSLITSIAIPNTVQSIGRMAFDGCKSLRKIIIPNSVINIGDTAFAMCKSLDSVILSTNLRKIETSLFMYCKSLSSIAIPESVIDIADSAFERCLALQAFNIPNNVATIGGSSFQNCRSLKSIVIPNSVTKIGANAFMHCTSLTSATILGNETEIESNAFAKCKSLETVVITDKNAKIGKNAFLACPKLGAVFNSEKTILYKAPTNWKKSEPYVIPESIAIINAGAFSCLSLLESIRFRIFNYQPPQHVILPMGMTKISNEAFADCRKLKSIVISDSVTDIGVSAFTNCTSLKEITLPEGVTTISHVMFYKCKSLKNVILPKNTTYIGEYAFYNCKSLKSITIPESVVEIGKCAFKRCYSIKSLTIPASVKKIDDEAFIGCKHLIGMQIPETVSQIGDRIFGKSKNNLAGIITEKLAPWSYNELGADLGGVFAELRDLADNSTFDETDDADSDVFSIPMCEEMPRAMVCGTAEDIARIDTLLTELYWEGFNIFYNIPQNSGIVEDSQCLLAFISPSTLQSEEVLNVLRMAVQHDVSHVIQVYFGGYTALPDDISSKLQDRQAIIQENLSEKEFVGKIRDSLRQFDCDLGHPRGFDVESNGESVKIIKFHPTDFANVIIPKTFFSPPIPVTIIGAAAFIDCEQIKSVIIPEGVVSIESGDGGLSSNYGAFKGCSSLQHVTLPSNLQSIGNNAFYSCDSLKYIVIKDGVQNINSKAFSSCPALKSIIIPDSVKHIGNSVFESCGSLTSIHIPDSVIKFGKNVFGDCDELIVCAPYNSEAWKYAQRNQILCISCDSDLAILDLALILYDMGKFLLDVGRQEESKECFQKSTALLEKRGEQKTGDVGGTYVSNENEMDVALKKVALMYRRIGEGLSRIGRMEEAVDYYIKSVAAFKARSEKGNSLNAFYGLAWTSDKTADLLVELERFEEAGAYYRTSFEGYSAAYKMDEEDATTSMAFAYLKTAEQMLRMDCMEEAAENYMKAAEMRKNAYEQTSDIKEMGYSAYAASEAGNVFVKLKRFDEAAKCYYEAIEARVQICDEDTNANTLIKLADAYVAMRDCFKKQKKDEEAIDFGKKAVEISKTIFEMNGEPGALNSLAAALANVRNTLMRIKRHEEAAEFCRQTVEITEKLCELRGGANDLSKLAWAFIKMGDNLIYFEQKEEAVGFYKRAVEVRERLLDEGSRLSLAYERIRDYLAH
jgi:tetratricopeptide (TPR) repeat protein